MNRRDLPAWITIWAISAAAMVAIATAPDLRKDAVLLLTGASTGAFAMLRGRE